TPAETPTVKDKGKGILIEAPKPMKKKNQVEMDAEYAKKLQEELDKEHEEAYKNIDWNAALDHVQSKEPQYIKRYHGIKKKPQTKSEARKNMVSYLKNTKGYKMEFFKGKTEEIEKEDEEIIKSINETPAQKASKRRKLSEEAQEADDLKRRLEIVQDEDDDVFVEAIPLAQKGPVVDYQIVVLDNKPKACTTITGLRAGLEEPEKVPLSPDYVPGPEEPEQAPLSPDYVPGLEEPEHAPPSPVYLPYKRLRFASPTPSQEVEESSVADAAR
nr:hypothetical protein [Tanacetum cinerariifolium]